MKNNKDKETPHYMKQWYLFYRGNTQLLKKLHQLGAESRMQRVLAPTKASRLPINYQA